MRYLITTLFLSLITFTTAAEAQKARCVDNEAGFYPCSNISLMSELDLSSSGRRAQSGNDIWGWTDPETGREYALMGLDSKTAFVDVTNPLLPVHIGDLPTRWFSSKWRDVKVYKNFAFIVSEALGHGMQIFDLTQLRGNLNTSQPIQFKATARYSLFGSAHNVFVNEESGYAYAVGTSTCDKGAHVIDVRDPLNPKFAACLDRDVYDLPSGKAPQVAQEFGVELISSGETYTHDIQCVIYRGPDVRYTGKEICISSNEDTVNITDVTDKSKPYQISAIDYSQTGYTHQGWLSEDQKYFFLGDELDEQNHDVNTTTFVFDFSDLENPKLHFKHVSASKAIDHNMYTHSGLLYQANYNSGLRILDYSTVGDGYLTEVAYFDTNPEKDTPEFEGVWSVYPYFASGNIIVSHIDTGKLFILKPDLQ